MEARFEDLNATVQWTVAADGSRSAKFHFLLAEKKNANKSGRYLIQQVIFKVYTNNKKQYTVRRTAFAIPSELMT